MKLQDIAFDIFNIELIHVEKNMFIRKACSVKIWCTKIERILRIVVQTGKLGSLIE